MEESLYPYLVCADDALAFKADTVHARDLVHACELGAKLVRKWRADAAAKGEVFAPRNGIRVFPKTGTFSAIKAPT